MISVKPIERVVREEGFVKNIIMEIWRAEFSFESPIRTKTGGGGGNRTRVRKPCHSDIYMFSRFLVLATVRANRRVCPVASLLEVSRDEKRPPVPLSCLIGASSQPDRRNRERRSRPLGS
jgi:hypothetical protein